MSISDSISKTAFRLLLPVAVLLLGGCQTPRPPIAVISPAPPLIGSAPIAAYDGYAWVINPRVGTPRSDRLVLISSR